MSKNSRIIIVFALIFAVALAVSLRPNNSKGVDASPEASAVETIEILPEEKKPVEITGEIAEAEEVSVPVKEDEESPKPLQVKENSPAPQQEAKAVESPAVTKEVEAVEPPTTPKALPKLIELGSESCVPCKMMKPILDELTEEYKGKLEIEIIDVFKDRQKASEFGVRMIPTQVFIGSNGEELDRHMGFITKQDILATFEKHGVEL